MQCNLLTEQHGRIMKCPYHCIGNDDCKLAREEMEAAEYEGMNRHEIAALRRNYGEPGAIRNLLDIIAATRQAKQKKRR